MRFVLLLLWLIIFVLVVYVVDWLMWCCVGEVIFIWGLFIVYYLQLCIFNGWYDGLQQDWVLIIIYQCDIDCEVLVEVICDQWQVQGIL